MRQVQHHAGFSTISIKSLSNSNGARKLACVELPQAPFSVTKRLVLLMVLAVSPACTSVSREQPSAVSLINTHTVQFSGATSDEHATQLELLLQQLAPAIDTLIISSGGGDVMAGMRIGRLVHQHQLKVIVDKVCASSCANYVVTASPDVTVRAGAILGWHGGASQSLYRTTRDDTSWLIRIYTFFARIDRQALLSAYMCRWLDEEVAFFNTIGADQAVTVLGLMPGYNEQRHAELFTYDTGTLGSLGLNIHFDEPQAKHVGNNGKVLQIFYIDSATLEHLLVAHRSLVNEKLAFCAASMSD